jgi:predicted Zn-dependent protease
MSDDVYRIGEGEAARIKRFLYLLAAGTVAFALLVVVAFVTSNRWLLWISHDSERRFIAPYVSWAHQHLFKASDPALQEYVDDLARQLAHEMDLPGDLRLEVRVVKGEMINAVTTLGGHIFVFEGLIEALDNENSLAMVIAHEIAHAKKRDPLLGTGRGMLLQILISSLSGGGVEPRTAEAGSDLLLTSYSRAQEEAADLLALAALNQRYGHVGGATQLFRKLKELPQLPKTMEFLSSHPDLGRRIAYIESTAKEKGWRQQPVTPYPPKIERMLRTKGSGGLAP